MKEYPFAHFPAVVPVHFILLFLAMVRLWNIANVGVDSSYL